MIGLWPSATPCSVCHHELESVHSPGVTSWERGFALALLHLILFLRLPFCGPQAGNRFYCAVLSVLKVACGAVWTNDIFLFASGVFVLLGLLSLMLVSYVGILQALRSNAGCREAVPTCSSHLCVRGFYFGTAMMGHLILDKSQGEEQQKLFSLLHTLFNPLPNRPHRQSTECLREGCFTGTAEKEGGVKTGGVLAQGSFHLKRCDSGCDKTQGDSPRRDMT